MLYFEASVAVQSPKTLSNSISETADVSAAALNIKNSHSVGEQLLVYLSLVAIPDAPIPHFFTLRVLEPSVGGKRSAFELVKLDTASGFGLKEDSGLGLLLEDPEDRLDSLDGRLVTDSFEFNGKLLFRLQGILGPFPGQGLHQFKQSTDTNVLLFHLIIYMLPHKSSPSIYQECKCSNQVLYQQTYLCNYCHQSFCHLCVRTQVVDVYCRGCNTPKSKLPGSSIYCPKCFECPECSHLLNVVLLKDQHVLKCLYCHWNSIQIKISGRSSDELFALLGDRVNNSSLEKQNFNSAKAQFQKRLLAEKAEHTLLPKSQIIKQRDNKFLMSDLIIQQQNQKKRLQQLDSFESLSLHQFKQDFTELDQQESLLPRQVQFNSKKSKACVKCGANLFSIGKQKSQKYFSGEQTLRLYPELRLRHDRKTPGMFEVGLALFNYSVRAYEIEVKEISANVHQVSSTSLRLQEYMVKKQGQTLKFYVTEETGKRQVNFWFRLRVKSSEDQRLTNKIFVKMGAF